ISKYATSVQLYIGPRQLNFTPLSQYNVNMSFPISNFKTSTINTIYNGWGKITFVYQAYVSGLHQIVIGNFHPNLTTLKLNSTAPVLPGVGKLDIAYYFIDDFDIQRLNLSSETCCNFDHIVGYQYDYGSIIFDDTLTQYNIQPNQKVLIANNYNYTWISEDVTYKNVDFVFDSDAFLFIDYDVNVVFENCHLHGCYSMWGGMQGFTGNGSLTFKNCIIEDMESGISLAHGMPFQCLNSTFQNNWHSLGFGEYDSIWPVDMRGNKFRQMGNFKPFVSYYPYQIITYPQPNIHIRLKDIGWFSLVSPPGIFNRNVFSDAIIGIRASNTGITLSNIMFQQIRKKPYSLSGNISNIAWAVQASADLSKLYGIKINDQWGEFRIQQSDNGINISGGYYAEIENGHFYNLNQTAVLIKNTNPWPWWNSNLPQIKIVNNEMLNATHIDLYNFNNTQTLIDNNTIINLLYRDKNSY
ncbi:MAG: hypothetical protein LC101_04385, partial [Flavobacteriales bacterium]|nr:hypothetical protein [Flavobacteriales bacterium]